MMLWYNLQSRLKMHNTKGRGFSFQDYVATILEYRYRNEFVKSDTWGNEGDWGCDGYNINKKIVYAMYSPKEINMVDMKNKIRDDYRRAKEKWPQMEEWTFIYNSENGPPGPLINYLDDLVSQDEEIKLSYGGHRYGVEKLLELNLNDL